jgi:hypothetical protein
MRVFLSSTAKDLRAHRAAVIAAIDRLDDHVCVCMERFGARPNPPIDVCRKELAASDVYVALAGLLYGSCPPDSKDSYTELEFCAASALPKLVFMTPEDFPLPGTLREPQWKWNRQKALRAKMAEYTLDPFVTPEEVAAKVATALANLRRAPREERHSTYTTITPAPPQPDVVHPYPLQNNFTGRRRERLLLTRWMSDAGTPVLTMTAIGGMGKSALVWAWVKRDLLGLPLPGAKAELATDCRVSKEASPDGLVWWSFYERGADFKAFLQECLTYASAGKLDPKEFRSTHEQASALIRVLERQRILLILDGFERELRAYSTLDAPYHHDPVLEDARGDFRACTDPNAGWFLRSACAQTIRGKLLLTSRLNPRDLDDIAGSRREDLEALAEDDAVEFLRSRGVQGTRAQLATAGERFGNHPLALRLLAGVITRHKINPGDIRVAEAIPVVPSLKAKSHHILEVAFEALDTDTRDLLTFISAFRGPVTYDAVTTFRPTWDEQHFDLALEELINRGLLLFHPAHGIYDLHPIMRQYAYDRLTDKTGIHTRLRDYFAVLPQASLRINSLEDLRTVIEFYHHTVRSGRAIAALRLYRDRLAYAVYHRFAAYQVQKQLLQALLASAQPTGLDPSDHAWALNEFANACYHLGEVRNAVLLYEQQLEIRRRTSPPRDTAIGLANLGQAKALLGELSGAEVLLRQALRFALEIGNTRLTVDCRQKLGRLLLLTGATETGYEELDAASELLNERAMADLASANWVYRAMDSYRSGDLGQAAAQASKARDLADILCLERDVVRAEWLLGRIQAALGLETPARHLDEALRRCRQTSLVEYEGDVLLACAEHHTAIGAVDLARQEITEALEIATRCEFRILAADLYNYLAGHSLASGDKAKAGTHAQQAWDKAFCDGHDHWYSAGLQTAEGLIAQAYR